MLSSSSRIGKVLPKEYRKVSEALFPEGHWPPNEVVRRNCLTFADKLGVGTDYRKLDTGWKDPGELEKFLHSFRNNLELLIQKTWVEKADEDRKEKLLDRIPEFIDFINQEDFAKALGEFGAILKELAWLLFGSQSHKEDFFNYVFRIDDHLGLFWWYSGQLEHFLAGGEPSLTETRSTESSEKPKDKENLRGLLFLGLCYLTDF